MFRIILLFVGLCMQVEGLDFSSSENTKLLYNASFKNVSFSDYYTAYVCETETATNDIKPENSTKRNINAEEIETFVEEAGQLFVRQYLCNQGKTDCRLTFLNDYSPHRKDSCSESVATRYHYLKDYKMLLPLDNYNCFRALSNLEKRKFIIETVIYEKLRWLYKHRKDEVALGGFMSYKGVEINASFLKIMQDTLVQSVNQNICLSYKFDKLREFLNNNRDGLDKNIRAGLKGVLEPREKNCLDPRVNIDREGYIYINGVRFDFDFCRFLNTAINKPVKDFDIEKSVEKSKQFLIDYGVTIDNDFVNAIAQELVDTNNYYLSYAEYLFDPNKFHTMYKNIISRSDTKWLPGFLLEEENIFVKKPRDVSEAKAMQLANAKKGIRSRVKKLEVLCRKMYRQHGFGDSLSDTETKESFSTKNELSDQDEIVYLSLKKKQLEDRIENLSKNSKNN